MDYSHLQSGNRETQPQLQQFIPGIALRRTLTDPVNFRHMYQSLHQLFQSDTSGRALQKFVLLDPSPDRFTWWVQWANARSRNIGWRIDYQIATPGIAKLARKATIYTAKVFSDHAPVVVDYDYAL